jgi:hypothetical protein
VSEKTGEERVYRIVAKDAVASESSRDPALLTATGFAPLTSPDCYL